MIQQERVTRGAKLLDEKVPDWYKKIDLDHLNMHKCLGPDICVASQLMKKTEDWSRDGLKFFTELGIIHGAYFSWLDQPIFDYGFSEGSGCDDTKENYIKSTALWRLEILNRRNPPAFIEARQTLIKDCRIFGIDCLQIKNGEYFLYKDILYRKINVHGAHYALRETDGICLHFTEIDIVPFDVIPVCVEINIVK